MAARGQLQKILCAQKLRKLYKLYKLYKSHFPRYGDKLVIFFKVLLKFKMAALDQLHIFLWPK